MKGAILIIALLVISVFAGVFALADEDNDASLDTEDDETSVDVEDVEVEGVDSEEVEETLDELEEADSGKRVGFVKIWRANGWVENGEVGNLINGFWVSHRVVNVNDEDSVSGVRVIKALGRLHIAGVGNYKLIKQYDNSDNETVSFYLLKIGKKRYDSTGDANRDAVGELVLTVENEYKGLTTWNGELTFYEGERYEGTWNVKLATSLKTMKPRQAAALADATKAARRTFWQRMQFWKRWAGEKPGSSDQNAAGENPPGQGVVGEAQANAKPIQARPTGVQANANPNTAGAYAQ